MTPMRSLFASTTLMAVLWTAGASAFAQQPEPAATKQEDSQTVASEQAAAAATAPTVEDLGDNRYRLGTIEFNGKTREIRVPTLVNMSEGILEYAVVHGDGKIHESLLVTDVPPSQLQVVMKLCRYQDGEGDVFDAFFPEEEKKGAAGARDRGEAVALTVEWEVDGEHKAKPLSDWIFDRKREAAMLDEPWIYSGSYIYEGIFMADADGLLVAIYLTRGALLNTMTEGSDNDERWLAHAEATPEIGTPVTLVLAPVPNAEGKGDAADKARAGAN